MSDTHEMPARIWANAAGLNGRGRLVGAWRDGERLDFDHYCNERLGITEYRRAGITPTTAEAMRCPEARVLIEAARAALTEIAAISAGPIRRIALDALEKMETD